MNSFRTVLVLTLSFFMSSQADADPLSDEARTRVFDKTFESTGQLAFNDDLADALKTARQLCEDALAIAKKFDPDDWAQGQIDMCFADVAVLQNDRESVCKLRTSQIAHFERALATGKFWEWGSRESIQDWVTRAKKSQIAFQCE